MKSMLIDINVCNGCHNCQIACKDEHVDNEWPGYSASQPRHGHRWMDVARKERGQFPLVDVVYRPTTCMQCADAPCMDALDGTVTRRDDGIVLIDPVNAKGEATTNPMRSRRSKMLIIMDMILHSTPAKISQCL